jgi:hypothetical protein
LRRAKCGWLMDLCVGWQIVPAVSSHLRRGASHSWRSTGERSVSM